MKKQYDALVFIGRFQPFHLGHLAVVDAALQRADRLILAIGSIARPRSIRDPFTFDERREMIRAALGNRAVRVDIVALPDLRYQETLWVQQLQQEIATFTEENVGLIGMCRNGSGYYPGLFPQWPAVDVAATPDCNGFQIRNAYFANGETKAVPGPVAEWLTTFATTGAYQELAEEAAFIADYKAGWDAAPYAPTFVTTDAVVVQSGHILLIERRARPGKGLWALPGGFVDQNEYVLDACLRELREETRLKVPAPVLRGSVAAQAVFDDPYRSARGRTITHAYYFKLRPETKLPKVKGGDDAADAFWLPLAELDSNRLFEDHYDIINKFLAAG